MRMKEPYEAYIDDYSTINVYMSKNFFEGKSSSFHLKDSQGRIVPLSIQQRSDLYNGYTHYKLSINEELEVGEEYNVYDEHCKTTPAKYSHIVKTERFSRQFTNIRDDLGVEYTKEKTTFRLWAPTTRRILLCLDDGKEKQRYEMTKRPYGLFEFELAGDHHGKAYSFLVRREGEWKECIDPYSLFSNANGRNSIIIDPERMRLPEKVEMEPLQYNTDAIIYEANVRDMTSQSGIGVEHPKTFAGFIEENETTKAKDVGFSYLKSLGITHVQLMPVFDFGSVDEDYPDRYYNWGYDPVQFRVPEGSYALDPEDPLSRVRELAELVHRCHENGMKVNLDVVFNHVYEKERFALDTLVPNYYFLMNQNGEFSNGSFCGNDIDTQPIMSKRYFINTCRKIISLYDIDGFRFDLMGILDLNFMNELSEECRRIKPGFMIYGEGWNMLSFLPENLHAAQQNQNQMPHVGHFSDRFRETIRGSNGDLVQKGYASGNLDKIAEAQAVMAGSCQDFVFNSPQKVVNFVECHDNHTLWDKNRVACHGEGRELREKRQVLANAMVLLAQGIPFLHAGQEFGRTKHNQGNTYNHPDNVNQMDYERRNRHMPIVEATKTLIQLRRQHPAFRLTTSEQISNNVHFETIDNQVLVYKTSCGSDANIVFFNPTSQHFQYVVHQGGEVLFDNGQCNEKYATNLQIAPYSVVVYHFNN